MRENNECYLNNNNEERPNFKGVYSKNGALTIFELEEDSAEPEKLKLFIKVNSLLKSDNGRSRSIAIGKYLMTFRSGDIVSSTIVFQHKSQSKFNKDEFVEPAVMNHEHEGWDKIDPEIKEFLSISGFHYQKLPHNINYLSEMRDAYKKGSFAVRPNIRNIQVEKLPKVTISFNTVFSKKNKRFVEKITSYLKYELGLGEQLNVRSNAQNQKQAKAMMLDIKSSNLFISFVAESPKMSFTMLQLGIAYSHTNSVLVFAEKNVGSTQLKTFLSDRVWREYEDFSDDSTFEQIRGIIHLKIKDEPYKLKT